MVDPERKVDWEVNVTSDILWFKGIPILLKKIYIPVVDI